MIDRMPQPARGRFAADKAHLSSNLRGLHSRNLYRKSLRGNSPSKPTALVDLKERDAPYFLIPPMTVVGLICRDPGDYLRTPLPLSRHLDNLRFTWACAWIGVKSIKVRPHVLPADTETAPCITSRCITFHLATLTVP